MNANGEWIIKEINEKVDKHGGNEMELQAPGEKYYQKPLIGFVRGDDDIFNTFSEVIGPEHLTPHEIMKWQAEKHGRPAPGASDITTVSYVLPLNKKTIEDNASNTEWLSASWAQTRLFGENFNRTITKEIVEELMSSGILAAAPDQLPLFKMDKHQTASTWSHRHIAYAAGLGTFGINDFLITEKGTAHRCGSFLVNLKIAPVRVRPADIHADCLHYQGIPCLKCAARCPVKAINKNTGHDKNICKARVLQESAKICKEEYKLDIYGCGLCSTKVPCESGIPEELKK